MKKFLIETWNALVQLFSVPSTDQTVSATRPSIQELTRFGSEVRTYKEHTKLPKDSETLVRYLRMVHAIDTQLDMAVIAVLEHDEDVVFSFINCAKKEFEIFKRVFPIDNKDQHV